MYGMVHHGQIEGNLQAIQALPDLQALKVQLVHRVQLVYKALLV